jgi:hypothetical protein
MSPVFELAEITVPAFKPTNPPAYTAPPAPPFPAAPPTPPVPDVVKLALPPAPPAAPFLPADPVAVTVPLAYTMVDVPVMIPDVPF